MKARGGEGKEMQRCKLKAHLIASLLLVSLAVPLIVLAQPGGPGLIGSPSPAGTARGDLRDVLLDLINFVLAIVGIIAVAVLIYGGFRYITSIGNEEAVAEAKKTLIYAIVGLVVIGLSAVLVNFVIRGVGGAVPEV